MMTIFYTNSTANLFYAKWKFDFENSDQIINKNEAAFGHFCNN